MSRKDQQMMEKPDDARTPGRLGWVTAPLAALALTASAVLLGVPVLGSCAAAPGHPVADVGWNGAGPAAPTG
jgi:hypothetical protein